MKKLLRQDAERRAQQLIEKFIRENQGVAPASLPLTLRDAIADQLEAPISFFGIYCPQHNIWSQDPNGNIYYYPSAEIASAHIDTYTAFAEVAHWTPIHKWEPAEFGKQVHTPKESLPPGQEVCPGL